MKTMILAIALLITGAMSFAETTADDAERAIKKGAHRTEETMCAEGQAKCLAKKIKHRADEAKDYTKDKTKEMKNDMDEK